MRQMHLQHAVIRTNQTSLLREQSRLETATLPGLLPRLHKLPRFQHLDQFLLDLLPSTVRLQMYGEHLRLRTSLCSNKAVRALLYPASPKLHQLRQKRLLRFPQLGPRQDGFQNGKL